MNGGQRRGAFSAWGGLVAVLLLHGTAVAASRGADSPLTGSPSPAAGLSGHTDEAPAIVDAADDDDDDPAMPSLSLLRNAVISDVARARPTLRRVARSAADPASRSMGLQLLAQYDPGPATARICARAVRVDSAASVRRAGAECLGRLPAGDSAPHTPVLLGALHDRSLNVVTMAGWSLSLHGEAGVIEALASRAQHPDPRVAALFREYAARAQARAEATRTTSGPLAAAEVAEQTLAPADELLRPRLEKMELAASAAWLATWGGVVGWYHGGILAASDGSSALRAASSLAALTGGAVGAVVGASYSLTSAQRLAQSHAIVQLGSFGWLTGYGAGMLGSALGASGLDVPAFALAGTLVGAGFGVGLSEPFAPSAGGLAWGMAAALGVGIVASSIAGDAGFSSDNLLAAGLFAGGLAGGVTTLALAPLDLGVAPALLATAGGLLGAQAGANLALSRSGLGGGGSTVSIWWQGAGLLAGSTLAALAGALWFPPEQDPFAGGLRVDVPRLAMLPPVGRAREAAPAAVVRGFF